MLALDTDRKIIGLYIFSATVALFLLDTLGAWLKNIVVKEVWKTVMQGYSGWFGFVMSVSRYVKVSVFILMGYLFAVVLSFKRIKRVSMDEALKGIE